MKILPTSNYQSGNKQNANFGMLKVVDANTPAKVEKAIYMIRETKVGYKPFKISDALNPGYEANVSKDEGGFYLGNLLDPTKLQKYRKQGENVLIFDEELISKICPGDTAKNFDDAFNNPVEMTMAQLRELYLKFKKQNLIILIAKKVFDKVDKALGKAKEDLTKMDIDTYKAFGL